MIQAMMKESKSNKCLSKVLCSTYSLKRSWKLPMDTFHYLWTLFTTCGRFFTTYGLFLNDYGLLWTEMGCLDGGLGDSLWIACGEDLNL